MYGLFKKKLKKTEDISDKLQNILQSFLLKSKLCAYLYVKYFIRDFTLCKVFNRDLILLHLLDLERKGLLVATFLRLRGKSYFSRSFSHSVFQFPYFREDAEVFSMILSVGLWTFTVPVPLNSYEEISACTSFTF